MAVALFPKKKKKKKKKGKFLYSKKGYKMEGNERTQKKKV
jgi:hypothetical protein